MLINLDGSDLAFERDSYIEFIEEGHRYVCDDGKELTPVSRIVGQYFAPFNADFWASRTAHKLSIPVEMVLEQWEEKKLNASSTGTFMHKQIEQILNGKEAEKSFPFSYSGEYVQSNCTNDVTKELGYFKTFMDENDVTPFRTEWVVYDRELGISGTADLVCRDGDSFELFDWKRSAKVIDNCGKPIKQGFRNKSGLNGLEMVCDTPYGHYCIQQNLYRYILEKNYGIKISRMTLVVLHPDYDTYHKVDVPRMDAAIKIIADDLIGC